MNALHIAADDDLKIPAFLDMRRYDEAGNFIRKTPEELARLLGNGQRVWVMPSATPAKTTATAVSAAPAVKAPKAEPKRVQGAGGVGRAGTTAETVRAFIREAMQKGLTVDTVIERCKAELNFADSKAKRYATENWERVKKAK